MAGFSRWLALCSQKQKRNNCMQLVDTHCHIHFGNYPLDPEQTLESAAKAGVSKIICVGCSLADSKKAINFAAKHKNVWASVGAHPHDGQDFLNEPRARAQIKEMLSLPKVVAIGEIGLDYYHQHTSREDQEKVLREQLEIGEASKLPFIFHVRDAWEDFWRIISDYEIKKAVVHSFSATSNELEEIISRGFYVSLNGIMTFTKDPAQLAAAKKVPLDRLLLETDAPFLTPKPDRGKICEPKHVLNTAEFLASLRGESLNELASATTNNAERLFKI